MKTIRTGDSSQRRRAHIAGRHQRHFLKPVAVRDLRVQFVGQPKDLPLAVGSERELDAAFDLHELSERDTGVIHAKAMPVILRDEAAWKTWLKGSVEEALALQRPAQDGTLKIVARGERKDGLAV